MRSVVGESEGDMNTRTLKCGKEIMAVGMENGLADAREKALFCLFCEERNGCEHYESYANDFVKKSRLGCFIKEKSNPKGGDKKP